MAHEERDYSISQPLEIQTILSGLLAKRTLVRLDVPKHVVSIISTLLEVDQKAGVILLDSASEDEINTQLLRAPVVRLQGMLERIMIEFSGRLMPAMHGGRPAFAMALPQQLRRMQRRAFFRVDVPTSNSTSCLIEDASMPSGKTHFRILDFSGDGVRLADADKLLANTPVGTIFEECTLDLAGTDAVEVSLRLLRTIELLQENGKTLSAVAFRFFNLPANRQIAIQQFVGTLERAVIARRWGIE